MTTTPAPSLTPTAATELFRTPPHRWIDGGEGQAAHRRIGTGPDVLFVHGWPVSGATFRTLLPHLVDHVTCHVIDLPGAGDSRFGSDTEITVQRHIESVRRIVDALDLDSVAVVGHDSGGLIARHALAGDPRLRAMGLLDTEQSHGLHWRFRSFLSLRNLPGAAAGFRWAIRSPRVRRNELVLGGAFTDRTLLDGEFDEFFLRPLYEHPARLDAAVRLLRSFDRRHIRELADVHRRIDAPVRLVWADRDPFFPLAWAQEMVATFPQADLRVVKGTRLFLHEERPTEVAEALRGVLVS